MNDVLLTNIFFTITAAAILAITAAVLLALWYIIPMLRDLRDVVARVRKAGESVEKDFEDLRANLRQEGTKSKLLVDMAIGFVARKLGTLRKKTKEDTINQ